MAAAGDDTREQLPTCEDLAAGISAFEEKESRGRKYFEALAHVNGYWGDPQQMAVGVKMLLDAWHQVFYRFGAFEPRLLVDCIERNLGRIDHFRPRQIASLVEQDRDPIKGLFEPFLDALRGGKRRSPVAVAKTLHLFAPEFFPLWDEKIALGYGSWWWLSDFGAMEYVQFCWKMKRLAEHFEDCPYVGTVVPARSLLKLIDEYNYSKFTKGWI